jgi:hypothetical protein
LSQVSVHYTVSDRDRVTQDTTVITGPDGIVSVAVTASADPTYTYLKQYKTEFKYRVSKEGYYQKSGSLVSKYSGENYSLDMPSESETVTLIKPTDYFVPTFLASNEGSTLKVRILGFIDILILRSLLSDSYLQVQAINLVSFKEKKYLTFKFINTNTYNSLKLNKYDIAKILFDEVIRKILTPLNDNLGDTKSFFGYDLTVVGYTKSFAQESAIPTSIIYRFLIPKETVLKYKNKDISGQQVLDQSVILMDDERIDLKLQ